MRFTTPLLATLALSILGLVAADKPLPPSPVSLPTVFPTTFIKDDMDLTTLVTRTKSKTKSKGPVHGTYPTVHATNVGGPCPPRPTGNPGVPDPKPVPAHDPHTKTKTKTRGNTTKLMALPASLHLGAKTSTLGVWHTDIVIGEPTGRPRD